MLIQQSLCGWFVERGSIGTGRPLRSCSKSSVRGRAYDGLVELGAFTIECGFCKPGRTEAAYLYPSGDRNAEGCGARRRRTAVGDHHGKEQYRQANIYYIYRVSFQQIACSWLERYTVIADRSFPPKRSSTEDVEIEMDRKNC